MTVSTAYLIQRILSPTGPSGTGPVLAATATSFRMADVVNPRGAATAEKRVQVLPLAA